MLKILFAASVAVTTFAASPAAHAQMAGMGGYGQTGTPNQYGQTLTEWASSTWGTDLFGSGATINNIQLGIGSSTQTSTSWIDDFTFSGLDNGTSVNFVPEPSSLGLVGLAGLALLARRSRRNIA